MKSSAYNHFVDLDGVIYGYNFLYKTSIRIPTETFPVIQACLASIVHEAGDDDSRSNPWLEILKKSSFIIDSDFDELNLIKVRYNQNLFANSRLHLNILPTLWCNFDCPYCFQFKKKQFMDRDVQDALMRWFEKRFKDKRGIGIHWFGGEPLLAKETIIELTERIKSFCRTNQNSFGAGITTNGYLLDKGFIDALDDLGIEIVHVTIDGDQETHDSLRRTRQGKPTFSRIYENILTFCRSGTKSRLLLRFNCCDDNYQGVMRMLAEFPEYVRDGDTSVYFEWVVASEPAGNRDFSCNERGEVPYEGLGKLYQKAIELGWKIENPSEEESFRNCGADALDSYSLDPRGQVYFCSGRMAPKDVVGSIMDGDGLKFDDPAGFINFYAVHPFDDVECLKCKLLPLCCGGCRKRRIAGEGGCREEKLSLDEFVRNIGRRRISNSTGSAWRSYEG